MPRQIETREAPDFADFNDSLSYVRIMATPKARHRFAVIGIGGEVHATGNSRPFLMACASEAEDYYGRQREMLDEQLAQNERADTPSGRGWEIDADSRDVDSWRENEDANTSAVDALRDGADALRYRAEKLYGTLDFWRTGKMDAETMEARTMIDTFREHAHKLDAMADKLDALTESPISGGCQDEDDPRAHKFGCPRSEVWDGGDTCQCQDDEDEMPDFENEIGPKGGYANHPDSVPALEAAWRAERDANIERERETYEREGHGTWVVTDDLRAARAIGSFLRGASLAGLRAKLRKLGNVYSVARVHTKTEDGSLYDVQRNGVSVPDLSGFLYAEDAYACAIHYATEDARLRTRRIAENAKLDSLLSEIREHAADDADFLDSLAADGEDVTIRAKDCATPDAFLAALVEALPTPDLYAMIEQVAHEHSCRRASISIDAFTVFATPYEDGRNVGTIEFSYVHPGLASFEGRVIIERGQTCGALYGVYADGFIACHAD